MKVLIISLCSALLLSACGGSSSGGGDSTPTGPSYTGLTDPAAIDSNNVDSIATKTSEATAQAITNQSAQDANPFIPSGISINAQDTGINQTLIDIAKALSNNPTNLPVGVDVPNDQLTAWLGAAYCGGTVSIDNALFDSFNDPNSETLNGNMTFTNLCYNDPDFGDLIMNGTIKFIETDTSLSFQYINFSVSDGNTTQTLNMTVSCDFSSVTGCSISSDYTGTDGNVYRIADVSITGSGTGPYTFEATFYHPEFGSLTVTTTDPIYMGCTNGHPSSGTLQFIGENGSSGTITFNDCDNYSVSWADTVPPQPVPAAGEYSGSWL